MIIECVMPAFVALRCCQGTSTVASYAGTGSTVIELPTCQNGIKDGAEPDVDCGGLCKVKCGPQKKCTKGGDCFNGMCLKNTCGGKSGTNQQEVGATCLCNKAVQQLLFDSAGWQARGEWCALPHASLWCTPQHTTLHWFAGVL